MKPQKWLQTYTKFPKDAVLLEAYFIFWAPECKWNEKLFKIHATAEQHEMSSCFANKVCQFIKLYFNMFSTFPDYVSDGKLFQGYPPALLTFASIACVTFIFLGVPGNLITIIALARCKKVS